MDNYVVFFSEPWYLGVVSRTFIMAVGVTLLSLLIGYPVAYFMARIRSNNARALLLATFLSPYFVSAVVRIYGWMYILSDDGLINGFLMQLNLIKQPFHFLKNISGVMIGLVEISLTVTIFTIYGVIGSIDPNLEHAARIHGATPMKTFVSVTLPLSAPGIVAASLLVLGSNMGAFLHPWLLGGGYVETLGTAVMTRILAIINYPFGTAIGFVMLGIFSVFLFVYLRVLKRSSTMPLGV